MQEKIIKLIDLAEIVNIKVNTLRYYLSNYRFTKYITFIREGKYRKRAYKITGVFANEMARILYLRQNFGAVKLWGNYCGENYLNILDKEFEDV